MSKEEIKEEQKPLATNEEIMDALAKDLVQLAQQTNRVMSKASVPVTHAQEAQLLVLMCNEIIETFVKPVEEEDEIISEESDS